jgi:hypothetical protein
MPRPINKAHMEKMRAYRAPFTEAREGRLKRQVRFAFQISGGKPLTTTELMKQCYCVVPIMGEKFKSWHRANVARAADLVAIRIGRAKSRGRPIIWLPRKLR